MTSGNDDSSPKQDEDGESTTALAHVADAAGALISGSAIPAPLRRNAFRAFNQLCSAIIDIPVAYLEGISAEKRAETQARIKIISTGADQIAEEMIMDPEYVKAAVKKFGQKIVREQVNLDQISQEAARQLNAGSGEANSGPASAEGDPEPINGDWLNTFEKEASEKSSEEMQRMFARILAGEIRRPSTFAIKTVRLLGQLDGRAASLFKKLCSLSVSLRIPGTIVDARVASLEGTAGDNCLKPYGLSFGSLNVLHEYGLIIPDYNSYMPYKPAVVVENSLSLPITYQNQKWALMPMADYQAEQEVRLHGVALSKSGAELLTIVDIEQDQAYTTALREYFRKLKLEMVQLPGGGGA